MSNMGSFATSVIYCPRCLSVAICHIHSESTRIYQSKQSGQSIVTGVTKDNIPENEYRAFEEIAETLRKECCHSIRLALMTEEGDTIFQIDPDRSAVGIVRVRR